MLIAKTRADNSPSELFGLGQRYRDVLIYPTNLLIAASPRIAPFAAGRDLSLYIDGCSTCEEIWEQSGLGELVGALLVSVLLETGIVSLQVESPEVNNTVRSATESLGQAPFAVPYAEVDQEASDSENQAREHVFALYSRLKPMTTPRDVLGISIGATNSEIDAAYERRMSDLDPARVPSGSARQLMVSRVDELREKVENAYASLRSEPDNSPW